MPPEPQTRKRPAGTGRQVSQYDQSAGDYTQSRLAVQTDPVDLLLSRLDNVRQFGKGWRADCPNGHSSRGSLSVAVGDDGRVLVNCFVGCPAIDVVSAAGLTIGDLFPARITHATTPQERRELRQRARESQWRAALGVLAREADVVLVAAHMTRRSARLAADDDVRLCLAVDRIASAKEVLRG